MRKWMPNTNNPATMFCLIMLTAFLVIIVTAAIGVAAISVHRKFNRVHSGCQCGESCACCPDPRQHGDARR